MDYRKDVRTPKDRVDDELLRRLLNESDALLDSGYGREAESTVKRRTAGKTGCAGAARSARQENSGGTGSGCAHKCNCGNGRNESTNGCGCARKDDYDVGSCIDRASMSIRTQGLPLVMSYAPDQEFCELYEDEEALANGTLFRELNLPFYGARCRSGCSGKAEKNCGCGDKK